MITQAERKKWPRPVVGVHINTSVICPPTGNGRRKIFGSVGLRILPSLKINFLKNGICQAAVCGCVRVLILFHGLKYFNRTFYESDNSLEHQTAHMNYKCM